LAEIAPVDVSCKG